MPINLFDSPLSSIKLGDGNLLKAYIGNGQIFPNDAEITAAAFTNANIASTGGDTPYVVSGEIGASFTLTGSAGATAPSGTKVISASPSTYQIAIGNQSTTCDAALRYPQVVIAPQGNTALASGLGNTDTIIQAAGPVTQTNNIGLTISVSNNVYATQNRGGVLYWVGGTGGSEWIVTVNYTRGSVPFMPAPNGALSSVPNLAIKATTQIPTGSANPANFAAVQVISPGYPSPGYQGQAVTNSTTVGEYGTGTYSVRYRMNGIVGYGSVQYVSFSVEALAYPPNAGYGCVAPVPSTVSTGNIYP